MPRLFLILLLTFFICMWGCESRESTPPQPQADSAETIEKVSADTPPKTARFLQEPLTATVVEHPAEALPLWRAHKEAAPTLLLISNNPFLAPIPEAIAPEAMELVLDGAKNEVIKKSNPQAPDPVLMPPMAVTAALRAGLFSKVVWLLPVQAQEKELSLTKFRSLILENGTVNEEEAATFELKGPLFSGIIRGVPWEVTPYPLFAGTPDPAVVHIDLGFFKALYRNEIKTPVHPLMYQVLKDFRSSGQEILDASISKSNVTGEISLQVRFLGELLARLFRNPELLDQELTNNDFRRHEALHLADFFKKEKRRELYLEMEEAAPEDAAVKYDLFRLASEFGDGENALAHLGEAVAIDAGYALEYLDLAEMALEKSRPDAALQMLDNALKAFPENPWILFRKAEILRQIDHPEAANALIREIIALPWSDVYYPQMKSRLGATLQATEPPVSGPSSATEGSKKNQN